MKFTQHLFRKLYHLPRTTESPGSKPVVRGLQYGFTQHMDSNAGFIDLQKGAGFNLMDFIYKLGLRQRMIIGGVILFLIGYFIYSLIIPPQLLNLKAVKKQLLTQNRFIESKKEKIKNLLILKEKYKELKDKAEESNRTFFTDDEAITFLKGLNNLVEEATHNNLIQIKPSSEETISESLLEETKIHYKRQDNEVVVTGKFSTIYDLIHYFNTSRKLLSLKELDIEIEKEEPLELRASFILTIYILSETECN